MISCTLNIVCYFHALGGQKGSLLVLPFFSFGELVQAGKRKKKGLIFQCPESICCCPGSCTLCLHTRLQCSGRRKCEHNLTLSSFCFCVHSSNSYWSKKKWWEGGIHCGSELIMESFLLSIFCNPIRKHFLFKLPHSFHFSC